MTDENSNLDEKNFSGFYYTDFSKVNSRFRNQEIFNILVVTLIFDI